MTASTGAAFPTQNNLQPDLVLTAPAVTRSYSTQYRSLIDGDAGTFQTLDAMKQAVLGQIGPDYSGYQDPFNIRAAHSICAHAPGQDQQAQIAALFEFASHKIRYVEHPFNTQVVQDAKRTIQIGSGDCVSLSVLLSTLLASLNIRSRFVAQWVDGESASHVYVEALLPDGSYLALDAVASDKPRGWRQPVLDGGFECQWEIF